MVRAIEDEEPYAVNKYPAAWMKKHLLGLYLASPNTEYNAEELLKQINTHSDFKLNNEKLRVLYYYLKDIRVVEHMNKAHTVVWSKHTVRITDLITTNKDTKFWMTKMEAQKKSRAEAVKDWERVKVYMNNNVPNYPEGSKVIGRHLQEFPFAITNRKVGMSSCWKSQM